MSIYLSPILPIHPSNPAHNLTYTLCFAVVFCIIYLTCLSQPSSSPTCRTHPSPPSPAPTVHLSLTEVSCFSSIPWPPLYAYLTYAAQYMQRVATVPSMMALIFSPLLSSPFRHPPSAIFLFPKTRCRCADVVCSAHRTDLIMLSHTCQCLDIVDADSLYIHTSVPAHI